MENSKILITAGCSFSNCIDQNHIDNWPIHLATNLNYGTSYHLGSDGVDNSYIANVICKTLSDIPNSEYKNIIVGVMWTGVSRMSFYFSNPPKNYFVYNNHLSLWYSIKRDDYPNDLSKTYYTDFYDLEGSVLNTYKNILLIQQILKLNNIKYFFTEYSHDCISNYNDLIDTNSYIKFLSSQLDKSNFLPVLNMSNWINENTNLKYENGDYHPTREMSKQFTEKVIMPHLKSKGYIE